MLKQLIILGLVAFCAARVQQRIVNGNDAGVGAQPHQASWRAGGSNPGSHSCGASLISSIWVVTAGHCISGGAGSHGVILGMTSQTDMGLGTPYWHSLSSITRHPLYDIGTGNVPNDIAVARLSGAAVIGTYIRTIAMVAQGAVVNGQTCTISGWGRLYGPDGPSPAWLQQADVRAMTRAECTSGNGHTPSAVDDGAHQCFGGTNRGACMGDSGGPAVCGGLLAGATSWGLSTCDPAYPSVYTKLATYRDWIRGETGV